MRRLVLLCPIIALALLPFTGAASAAQAVRTINLTAKEFSFTPAAISLKVGRRVTIQITNKGTMDHEFISPLLDAAKDVEIKTEGVRVEAGKIEEVEFEKGRTVTIELTPTKTGKFAFWCGEKTGGKLHRDLGMKGTFTVTR